MEAKDGGQCPTMPRAAPHTRASGVEAAELYPRAWISCGPWEQKFLECVYMSENSLFYVSGTDVHTVLHLYSVSGG